MNDGSQISDEEIYEAIKNSKAGYDSTPDITLRPKYKLWQIYRKMHRMVEKDLLNYGVSLRTAWINKE